MKTTLQPKLVTNLQVEEIEILDRDSHSLTLLTISTQSNITRLLSMNLQFQLIHVQVLITFLDNKAQNQRNTGIHFGFGILYTRN